MSCIYLPISLANQSILEELSLTSFVLETSVVPKENNDIVIDLPRGGQIIRTSVGNIQYGIPPETIKDSITMKLEVPKYFIIPNKRFDKVSNLNVAEFEFPAYYNFFIHKNTINLICDSETKECIRRAFQETLCGPSSYENLVEDFYYTYPVSGYPDFKKERKILSGAIQNPSLDSNPDTILCFSVFQENQIVIVKDNNTLIIQRILNKNQLCFSYKFIDNGKEIAIINDRVEMTVQENKFTPQDLDVLDDLLNIIDSKQQQSRQQQQHCPVISSPKNPQLNRIKCDGRNFIKKGSQFKIPHTFLSEGFTPPDFGISVIGNSHGFDPCGHTTGIIIWLYGRGIMVDPPPYTNDYLKEMNVSPQLIQAIIITHCHADHDSGAFEKILLQSKIELITTRTIMNSFVRKYSNITAMSEEEIKKLFVFRPVIIGSRMKINGGLFNFFYSFHVIPCIGFDIEVMGKSVYFSADTFYDPIRLKKYFEWGYLQKERYTSLVEIDWDKYDIILHEAGVPPIHTPQSSFLHFSEKAKKNLYLLHIAVKDVKYNEGFKRLEEGLENTIVLYENNTNQKIIHIRNLDLISNIDIFSTLTVKNVRYLLDCLEVEQYEKGDLIFPENSTGNKFFIVQSGLVKIFCFENQNFESFIGPGDYFGEISLIDEMKQRKASAKAEKKTILLSLERHDFQFLFGEENNILKKLKELTKARKQFVIVYLEKNNYFNSLDKNQKVVLEAILKEQKISKGTCVWKQGQVPESVVIVKDGSLAYFKQNLKGKIVRQGEFIGETMAIINKVPVQSSLKALQDTTILYIISQDWIEFLDKNPGVKLQIESKVYFR